MPSTGQSWLYQWFCDAEADTLIGQRHCPVCGTLLPCWGTLLMAAFNQKIRVVRFAELGDFLGWQRVSRTSTRRHCPKHLLI